MAIDTLRKRASIISFGVPIFAPGIIPDGTLDQFDRQVMAWGYAGVDRGGLYLYLDSQVALTLSPVSQVARTLSRVSQVALTLSPVSQVARTLSRVSQV